MHGHKLSDHKSKGNCLPISLNIQSTKYGFSELLFVSEILVLEPLL